MSSIETPVEVGEIIADKFRIERVLGRGGNGVVVQATHLQLDERVALKFVKGDAERVVNEARACLRLKTEHIARVMDVGRHRGSAFIVMEYLEGKDLERLLEENGRLEDPSEAVELVAQVCEAVAEAHRAGIVHRDIKLANLFLVASRTSMPLVKLLDFGIATSTTPASEAGAPLVGSLHYMAPEVLQGATDDPRGDIWSIGVVLFELLTGWKPFESKEVVALMAEIHEAAHLSLRSFREDLPEELEEIINRCLEKDPEARWANAGELATALRPFAPERVHITIDRAVRFSSDYVSSPSIPSNAPRSGPRSSSRMPTAPLRSSGSRSNRSVPSMTATSPNGLETRRSKVPWLVAGAAVLVLAAIFVLQRRGASEPASAVTAKEETSRGLPPPAPSDPPPTSSVAPEPSVVPGAVASPAVTAAAHPTRTTPPPAAVADGSRRPAPAAKPDRPAAPTRDAAAASTTAPTATTSTTSTKGVERDPWHSSKPKLEDNPFR